MKEHRCRSCNATLGNVMVDLGASPLSNRYLGRDELDQMEPFYPLTVRVCDQCWLVQLPEFVAPAAIFSDYAYFSSYSDSWLKHCEEYAGKMKGMLKLGGQSQVVEIASNDGYLLQYFAREGIRVLGVEPAANVAKVAVAKGIPSRVEFFGRESARGMVSEGLRADLVIGNNVLAHVPDINDFIAGLKMVLKPDGVLTMEFPHLLKMMDFNQFDTIYHEHFSYLSFVAVERAFARHGIVLFDVEELPTHGGSLRIYGRHKESTLWPVTARANELRGREISRGLEGLEAYQSFAGQVEQIKRELLKFLISAREQGKRVVGYGAPAKGNTLLNYCGVRTDLLDYTVDRSPHKQGHFLPGSRIPIYSPEKVFETKPDYMLILPWNLKDEIMGQMCGIREWGGKFVVPIPQVEVLK